MAGEPLIAFKNVQELVAAMTGISLGSIRNIAKEGREIEDGKRPNFSTPNKRKKKSSKIQLASWEQGLLRRQIINFHVSDKQVPTVKKIHQKFVQEFEYKGCEESMRLEIRKLGFRWKKTAGNRQLLMEKHDIRHLRLIYLRQIKKYRDENRFIVFTDETYLLSSHVSQNSWSDGTNDGLKKPVSKGQPLIIVGAGNEHGFVKNSYLKWKSKTKSGDYHDDMNFSNYKKWSEEKLLVNLPPKSVIVIDNAPYHNTQDDKAPTSVTRKSEMQEWLKTRNIPFEDKMLRPDLYAIIKLHKPKYVKYPIDKIIRDRGHEVLRLPLYHPDLNPIELVWAALKNYVGSRNVDFTFNSNQKLADEFFETFSVEEWKKITNKVIKIEEEFISNEPLFDEVIETLVINVGEDFESEDDLMEQDSDESDEDFDP